MWSWEGGLLEKRKVSTRSPSTVYPSLLLCDKPCARRWRFNGEQSRHDPCSQERRQDWASNRYINRISSDWSGCYERNKRWRYNREWLGGSTLKQSGQGGSLTRWHLGWDPEHEEESAIGELEERVFQAVSSKCKNPEAGLSLEQKENLGVAVREWVELRWEVGNG